jgi:PleD family two-component response regulator
MALKAEGYEIEEAINGEECLVKYARLQPDLVLLDAVMPEMDGFSCCQHIRALPDRPQIPILMITFLADRESIDQAFQAGATDYITKPIHWSVLRQCAVEFYHIPCSHSPCLRRGCGRHILPVGFEPIASI